MILVPLFNSRFASLRTIALLITNLEILVDDLYLFLVILEVVLVFLFDHGLVFLLKY